MFNQEKRGRANSYHFDELNNTSTTTNTAAVETKPRETNDVDWAAELKAVAEREAAKSVKKPGSPDTITNSPSAETLSVKPTVDTSHHDWIHSSAAMYKSADSSAPRQTPAAGPTCIYTHV